jgi:hypothetical protein
MQISQEKTYKQATWFTVHRIKRGLQFPVSLTIKSLDVACDQQVYKTTTTVFWIHEDTHLHKCSYKHTGGVDAWPPWRVSKKITDVSAIGRGIWLGSILDGAETWVSAWGEYGKVGVDGAGPPCTSVFGGKPPGMPSILIGGCVAPDTAAYK